jgi:hypothetical protein
MRVSGKTILTAAASCNPNQKPAPLYLDDTTLLFTVPITGGFALWQEDISGIKLLQKEIEESVSKQKAATSMLLQEEKIKRSAQEEIEKTRLLALLEDEISEHTNTLGKMIEQLDNAADKTKAAARIALLLCYIKRRCNLFFSERESRILQAGELAIYLDELAEIAGYSNIKIIVSSDLKISLFVRRATLIYDFFYSVIHWAAELDSSSIITHLGIENGDIVLRMLPSGEVNSYQMESALEKAIAAAGGTYLVKDLDDAVGLSLSFPQGSEANA